MNLWPKRKRTGVNAVGSSDVLGIVIFDTELEAKKYVEQRLMASMSLEHNNLGCNSKLHGFLKHGRAHIVLGYIRLKNLCRLLMLFYHPAFLKQMLLTEIINPIKLICMHPNNSVTPGSNRLKPASNSGNDSTSMSEHSHGVATMPNGQELSHAARDSRQPETRSEN